MEAYVRDRAKRLVENYQRLNKIFKFVSLTQTRLAAFYYAQEDRPVPAEEVRRMVKEVQQKVSPLSAFRGLSLIPLATKLTLDSRASLFSRTETIYRRLREDFNFSDHLVLASFELAQQAETQNLDAAVARMVELYRHLKKAYRLRIGNNELLLITRLALTGDSVANMLEQIHLCYDALRTEFSASGRLMGLALYLVLCGEPSKRLEKVVQLARKFKEYGHRVTGSNYLPFLGMLSHSDKDPHVLVEESMTLYEQLRKEKGFSGWHAQRYELLLYVAALLTHETLPDVRRQDQSAYLCATATSIAVTTQQTVASV